MPDTLITTIDINQAQTEAWTKRFRVTTRTDPIVVPSAHKLMLLSAKTPVDEELVIAKAQAAVNSWFEQGLLCELCSYIWDSVTGQTPLNFTLTAATQIAAAQDSQPVQSWEAKAKQSSGADLICQDIEAALAALSTNMGLDQESLLKRNMTLIFPVGYRHQLEQVKERIAQSYPRLKLLPDYYPSQERGQLSLILCDEGLEGQNEIGHFELLDSVKLTVNENQPNSPAYTLHFPSYSFSISAPEQIAVLTGI